MINIAIIGGAGFIGRALVAALANSKLNCSITIYDLISYSLEEDYYLKQYIGKNLDVRIVKTDLLNGFTFKSNPQIVINLAARLGVEYVNENPVDTLLSNVRIVEEVLKAISNLQEPPLMIIQASTSEVCAASVEKKLAPVPTPECSDIVVGDLTAPRTSYMLSKCISEFLVNMYSSEMIVLNIRFHNIYGPSMGNRHVIPQLISKINKAKEKDSILVYSPEHTRSFCFISDAVSQIINLINYYLEVKPTHESPSVINVGVEDEISIMKLAEHIKDLMHSNAELIPGPVTNGSPIRRCPSMKKQKDIGTYQQEISLLEGLQHAINYYK